MRQIQLKLKQASAVLGVSPKDLQNFVQLGVLRPRKRADVFWFDSNLLLQAKLAFYIKATLRPATEYLSQLTREISRVDLTTIDWDDLLLTSSPSAGKSPIEIRIPLKALKSEVEDRIPMAAAARDLPRGRKRAGWKEEFLATLQEAGDAMGEISEQDIVKEIKAYRSRRRKKKPEIRLVTQTQKTA